MMGRYLGPVLFLGICIYLLQDPDLGMSIPMINMIPGVGDSPKDMQFASAVVFGVVGGLSLVRRIATQARRSGESVDE